MIKGSESKFDSLFGVSMVEVVQVTLQGIGYSIFNMIFVMGIWLIYMMNRKLNELDFYRTVEKKPYLYVVSDFVLQGIVAGVVISLVMVLVGVPLYYNEVLLVIVPLSLILSMYRMRFICISYSAAVLSALALIFNGQQVFNRNLPNIDLHIPSILILVGLIHIIEGLFLLLDRQKRAVPVISKKDDQLIMGHIIQKTWLLPLSLLVLYIGKLASGGIEMPEWWPYLQYTGYGTGIFYTLLPLMGFMNFSTIVYSDTPRNRSLFSGRLVLLFGIFLVIIGRFTMSSLLGQIMGVLSMVLLHELIYILEKLQEEQKGPLYTLPESGLRIMQVLDGGYAKSLGIQQGDIIEEIDGQVIKNFSHYLHLIKGRKDGGVLMVKDVFGENKSYIIGDGKHLEHLGVRVIPDKPLFLYPYDKFSYMGIFDFIRKGD